MKTLLSFLKSSKLNNDLYVAQRNVYLKKYNLLTRIELNFSEKYFNMSGR